MKAVILCLLALLALSTAFQSIRLNRAIIPRNHHFNFHGVREHAFDTNFDSTSNQNMSGNIIPIGIYWTEVQIGTPPQTFQVAVDTGSQDLIVPEVGCTGCHTQITGSYSPSESSTSAPLGCHELGYDCSCNSKKNDGCDFTATYETCNLTAPQQPCSVFGEVYTDDFILGGQTTKTSFGLIQNQTKNFQQFFYIDGVMGFVPEDDSSFGGFSAFQRLVNAGLVSNIFAMCLNAQNGGVLTLGGTDPNLYVADFQYTEILSGRNGYQTPLNSIVVGNSNLAIDLSRPIIIDSGTNVLLLPATAYNNVQEQFQSLCPDFPVEGLCGAPSLFTGSCYTYSESDLQQFPSLTLELEGASLTINGGQYLISNSTDPDVYCLGITNTGPGGLAIIGDVVMQAYYTSFDNSNHQLGWAPVNATACA